MHLIPFVEQRGPGIPAHPHTPHFVDVQTRSLSVVVFHDIGEPCLFVHLSELFHEIGCHLLVVIVVIHVDLQLRDAPGILFVGVQRYLIGTGGLR